MIEPTVTQNGGLYFAQHKIQQPRIPLMRRFALTRRIGRRKAGAEWPTGAVFLRPHIHYSANR